MKSRVFQELLAKQGFSGFMFQDGRSLSTGRPTGCEPLPAHLPREDVVHQGRAELATRRLNAMREARTELVTPAPNRFVTDDHTALEQ